MDMNLRDLGYTHFLNNFEIVFINIIVLIIFLSPEYSQMPTSFILSFYW